MNSKIVTVLLFIVGLINFLPLAGFLSTDQLNKLYSISLKDENLIILMRHRALLFGLVGGFMMFAAFRSQYQIAAFVMGFISMLGFIIIAAQANEYNAAIKKIMTIDYIAIGLLSIALLLYVLNKFKA